jgi:hypothetical protein
MNVESVHAPAVRRIYAIPPRTQRLCELNIIKHHQYSSVVISMSHGIDEWASIPDKNQRFFSSEFTGRFRG